MKKKHHKHDLDLTKVVRERIHRLRKQRQLTQEALCDKAGISVDAVSRIESGDRVPTLETLQRIAAALNVRVTDILRETRLPEQRFSPSLQKIVDLLEPRSKSIHKAAMKAVQATIDAAEIIGKEQARSVAEEKGRYRTPALQIDLWGRTVRFCGNLVPTDASDKHGLDGVSYMALVVIASNSGKAISKKLLREKLLQFGVPAREEELDLGDLREKLLAPFLDLAKRGDPVIPVADIRNLIARTRGGLKLTLDTSEVKVVGEPESERPDN